MTFDQGLFTLTVDGKTGIKPSELRAAAKKYKITSLEFADLIGEASKDGDKVLFKVKGSEQELDVAKGKDPKAYDELLAKLGEGKTSFKLAGLVTDKKQKKDGKDVVVLTLSLNACSLVESK